MYRRYTEFREFHRQLQKHLPEVAGFNFPPKKALGNKVSGHYTNIGHSINYCDRVHKLLKKDGKDYRNISDL